MDCCLKPCRCFNSYLLNDLYGGDVTLRMLAKKTLAALCLFAFFASGIVYATSVLSWHQNLTVPPPHDFSVFPETIIQGSDQSATGLWEWDSTNHRFSATIQLTNNGDNAFTPTVTFGSVPSGWTGTTSTISSVAKDSVETITLYMTSTDANPAAGAIGDFTVSIT